MLPAHARGSHSGQGTHLLRHSRSGPVGATQLLRLSATVHHCPRCGRRQEVLPPFQRKHVTYTYRFEEQVIRWLIGSSEEDVARRLGIRAEMVATIVGQH